MLNGIYLLIFSDYMDFDRTKKVLELTSEESKVRSKRARTRKRMKMTLKMLLKRPRMIAIATSIVIYLKQIMKKMRMMIYLMPILTEILTKK